MHPTHQKLQNKSIVEIKTLHNNRFVKQYRDLNKDDPRNALLIQQLKTEPNVERYIALKNNIDTINKKYELTETVNRLREELAAAERNLYKLDGRLQRIMAKNLPPELGAYDAVGNNGAPSFS